VPVEVVFFCTELARGDLSGRLVDELRRAGAAAFEVSERVLRRMVDRDGPDGLAAIAHPRPAGLDDVAVRPTARLVIADSLDRPGNLGAIIRCADGAGAAGVVVTDRRIRLTHPLVLKASMGTVFSLPVVEADRDATLDWLRAHRFRIIAAEPEAPMTYRDVDYRGRVAIVVGSERHGLAAFWREAADVAVSIPMLGAADSLNVGHAAALLLYEALDHHIRGSMHKTDEEDA
jgi:TrmH family RNA methyltransferase